MKKNRLLFLLPLLASFVLTSCDMLSNLNFNGPRKKSSQEDSEVLDDSDDYSMPSSSSSKSSSKSSGRTSSSRSSSSSSAHQHEWADWIVVTEPTCTAYGMEKRECAICGVVQTRSVAPFGHEWGEYNVSIEATCTSSGAATHECLRCHESEYVVIPPRGHEWGEWDISSQATCTTDGVGRRTCSVCGIYEQQIIPAYGHSYNESNVNWVSQPTCTEDGIGYVRCTRCSEQVTVNNPALGHTQALLDYHAPQSGTADTRVYRCSRCGKASLSFGVEALSNESKQTLMREWFDDSVGYRFFGHPMGNAVEVNENGDVDSENHDPIFNPNMKGDFFEIIFNLTSQQATALGQCMLYCDAKPADWMAQNNIDFWAQKTNDTEWYRGFYIEGDKYGQEILDYRYKLYVDNQLVEFDPGFKTPVPSGNPRGEYAMPYIFNLHSGINKFSLHMAGGYKSTFYNFTFRPLDNPHTHTLGEWEYDETNHWKECTASNCFAAQGTQYSKGSHAWGERFDVVEPSCGHAGSYKQQCSVCGYVKVFTTTILSHTIGGEGVKVGDVTRYQCSLCNQLIYQYDIVSPQKLKSDITLDVTGLEPGTYTVQLCACVVSSTSRQDIVSGGSGRYQFRFNNLSSEYTSPEPGTYVSYGFGNGESTSNCAWTNPLVSLVAEEAPTSFTVHYGGQGYSALVSAIRLVKVA